jgi:F-type H+-transporting ATPase subunit gamma
MPSLKSIRTRIASVKSSQKITRAMKLVAAAKLRRSQEAIIAARPYAKALDQVIAELATRGGVEAHPLLAAREGGRASLIVLTSDRGLAGAFNTNIARRAERFLREEKETYPEATLRVIGKKGRDYFTRRGAPVATTSVAPTPATALTMARELAVTVVEQYLENKVDRVFLVYNEFKSAIVQKPTVEQLLPVVPQPLPAGVAPGDFIYEPGKRELLDVLLPLHIEIQIYRAHLESVASEFGARMSAMENATRNANEMIGRLTLQYNRARQAAITKELLEIIGGAEALKG